MSLTVQPRAFSDALNRVVGAVERSKTMPILSHVMMTTSGGYLTLRTTDLDVEITTTIDCEGSLPPTCAPMDKLQATVARLVDRGGMSFALDEHQLVLTSGRARFTMQTLAPDVFPSLKLSEIGATGTIEGKAFATLLNACAFAMANDAARVYLNGLFLFAGTIGEGKGGKLCGVATDGHKFSAREVPAELPDDFPPIIATRKSVNILSKMVGGYDEVVLEVSEHRLVATFGPTCLTSKLVEGTYPDWRRALPDVEPCLSYDSAELANAIGTTFAAAQTEKTFAPLKLTFGAEETHFSTRTRDGSTGGEDVCPHSQLEPPKIEVLGANPKLFLEIIEALNADTIQLGIRDPESAVLITAAGLEDRKAILMPMRV